MGFHLVNQVYANVTSTSSTQQAILAYLAHRADDNGVRRCFPSQESISAATHFEISGVKKALKALKKANLLTWKSGGRHKGGGGRALANEYSFNLPSSPKSDRGDVVTPAGVTTSPMQGSPHPPCIGHHVTSINNNQPDYRPSVTETDGESEEYKLKMKGLADKFSAKKAQAQENVDARNSIRRGVVEEAMIAAGVDDIENRKYFSKTVCNRDSEQCLEVIFQFASERRNGEHEKLRNPAAELNKRLAALPTVC